MRAVGRFPLCSPIRTMRYGGLLAVMAICLATAGILAPAAAQQQQAEDATDAAQARTLLMHMADTLAGAKSFSVTITDGYDVVQDSGQKIEFGDTRQVIVSRPNNLRVDVETRSGDKTQILFDGTALTQFSPEENVFARAARPGQRLRQAP